MFRPTHILCSDCYSMQYEKTILVFLKIGHFDHSLGEIFCICDLRCRVQNDKDFKSRFQKDH